MTPDYLGPNEVRAHDTIWHVPLTATPFGSAAVGGGTIEHLAFGANPTGRDCIHMVWTASGAGATERAFSAGIRDAFAVCRGSMIHIRFLLKGAAIQAGWKPAILVKGASAIYGGTCYYNTIDVNNAALEGTFDWVEVNYSATVNSDFIAADIVAYLNVDGAKSGECWMTGIRVTVQEAADTTRPAAGPAFVQEFAGLRGVQMHPNAPRDDWFDLGGDYGTNLVRHQINTWSNDNPALSDKTNMTQWDAWFAAKLVTLQNALTYARQNGQKIIVSLMTMPGGDDANVNNLVPYSSTYMLKYLDAWRQIATLCLGAPEVIAFDVMNEPAYLFRTKPQGPGMDFRVAQIQAIDAIREIDPTRWCVFEGTNFGDPTRLNYWTPIDRERILYSAHMYRPTTYTGEANTTLSYPGGTISGRTETGTGIKDFVNEPMTKAMLRDFLEPVRQFQLAYNVPIYLGEFSAARWAPGCVNYLQDVSDIIEEYGWTWTYHAFREANVWDVEYEALPANQGGGVLASGITDRGAVLRTKFALNAPSYTAAEQAPIGPTITVTDTWTTDARVDWTPARCLIGSWLVEHRASGGAWTSTPVARDQTSLLITGLTVGVEYDYRVVLVNVHGQASSDITTATKGAAYLLDVVAGSPAYAYAARQLRAAHSTALLRVRRSSDNAEQDILATGGTLDTTALLAFAGAGDAFVVTWYDQTGNARHLTQATAARQPRIVSGGVVDVVNTRPTVNLIAANSHWMSGAFAPLYAAGAATFVGAWRNNAAAADSYLFGESSSAVFNPFYDLTSGSSQSGEAKLAIRDDAGATFSGNGGSLQVQSFTNGTMRAFRVVDTGSAVRVASNAGTEAQDATYTRAAHTLTANQTALGARLRQSSADKFPSMSVGEIIAFPALLTDADEAIIQAHQVRWYGL